ncbi:hypothetical protein ACHAWO_006442 [Cyclotella atomus]|uniref:MYND-type domain-containing protein n=1 Tax=Cyclotella atomus TaxID=382360 RepID=A0ABD3NUR3_9STRA
MNIINQLDAVLHLSENVIPQCSGCHQMVDLKLLKCCGACHQTKYCTADCQNKHWPAHKKVCTNAKKKLFVPNAGDRVRCSYGEDWGP